MQNFYNQEVEAKEEEKKGVAVKETSNLETKVQLEILGTIDKDKDCLDTFCSLKTRQNTLQASSSALKTGAIASLRDGDDEIQESHKDRESKKRGLTSTESFKDGDSKESSKKLKTEEKTSENVTKKKCRPSLIRRLRRKGLSLPAAALKKQQRPILRASGNDKDPFNNSCLLNIRKNTLIEKSGSSEEADGADVSSLQDGNVKPETSGSLEVAQKKFETEEVFQELKHNFSPFKDSQKPDAVESNEDEESNKLGLISTESFEDEDSKESSKKLKIQECASEDIKKRKGHPSLRLRPLSEVDKIQKFGSLEISDVTESNKDGKCKQQAEEITPKLAVSCLQEGNVKPEVSDSCRMKQTETKGVTLLLRKVNTPETSDSLEVEQKKFETEEVCQELKHNFSPLEDKQKPDAVESIEGGESKKRGLTSSESSKDGDSKESSKKLKTEENTSENVTRRRRRPSLRRRLRNRRRALQLLVNKPLSEVDKIKKFGSSEIRDVAESNKDGEYKQQTEEMTPKPAVSSLQEGNNNPSVSDACKIEQTNSKSEALSSKTDSTPETSDSLEIGQKKVESKEVFQEEVRNNSENADPSVTEENPSGVHESLNMDTSSLKDSSIVTKKSETVEIPLTVATSLTEEGLLTSTEVENQPRVTESLETICETSKNSKNLGTTEVKNETGAAQESTVKRKKKKKKKKKPKPVEGILGNHPQATQSQTPNRFIMNPRFSVTNIWQYAGSRSNIPMYQEPLSGYPPALPLIPRNPVGNPRHLLYHQSLLGTLGLASLIQSRLGNQVTPLINQESLLGNRGVSPLLKLNVPANLGNLSNNQMIGTPMQANRPSCQGNLSRNPGNLSRYHENLGDQPRNHSMIRKETNPPSNEVKSEKPDKSQGSIGRQPRWEPPGNLPESQDTKERLLKWEPRENLPGNQDSKGHLSRWESISNLPGSQEYPSRYQDELLAQPSTSRSEIQSGDSYHFGECSSGSRKRRRSRDSHSPDDCKRSRSSDSESTSRNNSIFKLIISKDFGKLRLGQEELMLIRIAISQEIDRIPKGRIPRFNDTFLKVFGIVVDCADEWSRDWLADTITKISPWAGARLRLVDLPQTEKFYDAILFIPGVVEKAEIILGRLERQNPSLKTGNWKVYSVEEKCEQKGFTLKLGIPVPSLKALQDLNFQPFLGMTKVTITITKSVRIIGLDKEC